MFKPWKSSKRKIKATFILHFQVSQVPKLKKPYLFIQLAPEDIGKPKFKLEKAQVLNGKCSWENPIYVTVKFSIDPKTDKLHEKLYHFILSNGSSKSGYLGESSVDLADYANEIDPVTVSLPLKFANSGVVLHLTIRRVLEDGDGGFVEMQNAEEEQIAEDWSGSEGSLQNSVGNGEKEEVAKSEKPDVKELMRHAELADLEIQALKKQVVKEGRRVQELSNQMEEMRKERDALGAESSAPGEEEEGDGEAFDMLMSENRELKGNLRGLKRDLFSEKERTRELTMQLQSSKGSEAASKDEESERYILRKKMKDLSDEVAACKEEREKLEERVESLTRENEDLKAENFEANRGMEEMARRREDLAEREKLEDIVESLMRENEDLKAENREANRGIKELGEEMARRREEQAEQEKLEEIVESLTREKEDLKAENREANRGIEELGEEMARMREELAETVDYCEEKTRELEEEKESHKTELQLIRESKGKEEDRAKMAEDSLRKMNWKNSAAMERLREELRKKEEMMASALAEAENLRGRNEEMEVIGRRDKGRSEVANRRDEEVEILKERNRSMERDLKEMEERYSEMSLKFAEVEIERQQLVKTVRTLQGRTS